MKTSDQFERDLPDLLEELGMGTAPDYRDFIVQQTSAMRQRPAWTFPERWLNVDIAARRLPVAPINWRLLAVAGLLILAGIVVAILAAGSRSRLPAPPYGPAANGLIVYEANNDILVGDPVTGVSRVLIGGPTRDTHPFFSRDGTQLIFQRSNRSKGGVDLILAQADGTEPRVLTREPWHFITGGDWSGDGRSMVIVSNVNGRRMMALIDVQAGTVRPLDVGMTVTDATFRPSDATEIAFTGDAGGREAVFVVGTNDGNPRRLAFGAGPVYSPDGTRIAYHVDRYEVGSTEVVGNGVRVMDADGGRDHAVGDSKDIQFQGYPIWSPDSTRILVLRAYYPDRYQDNQKIAVVPADGLTPGQDIEVPTPGGFGALSWSPDGTQVVFTPADREARALVINLADGARRLMPRWAVESWQRLSQ